MHICAPVPVTTATMHFLMGFSAGKNEGLKEKLRSILAQFEFQHHLKQWEDKGVNIRLYLYVPEVHPETGQVFCEREDEAHVLKVPIYTCTVTSMCVCTCVRVCVHVHVCVHVLSLQSLSSLFPD